MKNLPKTAPIKAYSKSEICSMYGITGPTLQVWFKRAGLEYNKKVRIFTPLEVSNLFNAIGAPPYVREREDV